MASSWRYSKKYGRVVPLTKAGLRKLQEAPGEENSLGVRQKSPKGWARKPTHEEVLMDGASKWANMKSHNSDRRPFALARAKRRHERGLREI